MRNIIKTIGCMFIAFAMGATVTATVIKGYEYATGFIVSE